MQKIAIQCAKEDSCSNIIEKYKAKINEKFNIKINKKVRFIFNAVNLNPYLTAEEAGLGGGANIFVVFIK